MTFNSHITDLYSFKLSIIDSIISGVEHHFILLAFEFPATAQRQQLITHAQCIESLTALTRQDGPKCSLGKTFGLEE